eukprot:SAG31_NODE_24407_length_482_cov_0.812010_1_plen_116_part_10
MRIVDCVLCEKLGPRPECGAIPVRLYAVAPGIEEGDYTQPMKNMYTAASGAAVSAYIAGDWGTACSGMTELLRQNPNDAPLAFLLGYMQLPNFNGKAPSDWPGYRTVSADLPAPYE